MSSPAVRVVLHSVFQLRDLVKNLDHRIRIARVHQIHQTRRRKNSTLDGRRSTHILHELMTFASTSLLNHTCHIRNRVTRRTDQHKCAKVGSFRRSEHVRILKESLPQCVADDVLLPHRQVYSSLFFVIPTRQFLHTLLEFETTLRSYLDIINVLSPFQNTLHLHSTPVSSTVFSTSILTSVSIDLNGMDDIDDSPKSTR